MRRSDPTIDRIRQVRHEISERFGHDPARLVAHYMELDKKFADRLLKDENEEPASAATLHPEGA